MIIEKTLVNRKFDAVQHQSIWDGTNNLGQTVPSGIYVYRLEAEGYVAAEKMLLLK